MPKAEKIERVAALKERIEGSGALLLTEYRGLSVSDITDLRRALAEGGTSFAVVKNTLMRRAVADAGVADLEVLLEGPSAVAFVGGDPVAAAKKVVDAAKRFPTLVLKGGYLDGKVLSADEAKALADLDSREVMLSKIAGMVKSEIARAAAMFVAAPSKFLSVLEAYKEKLPAAEVPATDELAHEAAASESPTAQASSVSEAAAAPGDADASTDGEPIGEGGTTQRDESIEAADDAEPSSEDVEGKE